MSSLKCSNCQYDYEATKVDNLPFLLPCGCYYCLSCLKQLSRQVSFIKCPQCGVATPVDKSQHVPLEHQLSPHLQLLGLIVAREHGLRVGMDKISCTLPDLPSSPVKTSDASADLRIPLCSECGVRDASRHCGNCVASYCSTCDQVVHARGVSLRSHARVPVTQSLAPPSKCGEHPSEVIRYYCPRDHTLLCSECAVYGSHKEHSIVSVTAAAEEFRGMLTPLVQETEVLVKEMSASVKTLRDHMTSVQRKAVEQVEQLSKLMPTLYSGLQKREAALYESVSNSFDGCIKSYLQARACLEEHKGRVGVVIQAARGALKDDFKLLSDGDRLCQQLMEVKQFPAQVDVTAPKIKITLDQENLMRCLDTLGEISTESHSPTLWSSEGKEFEYQHITPVPSLTELRPPNNVTNQRARSSSPRNRKTVLRKGHTAKSQSPLVLSPSRSPNPPSSKPSSSKQLAPYKPSPHKRSTSPRSPHKGSPRIVASPVDGVNPALPYPSRAELEQLPEVRVVGMKGPWELYVREDQQVTRLEEIQGALNRHCNQHHKCLNWAQLREGYQYAAQFSQDQRWYRAVVEEVVDSYVAVHYIDYGNNEKLTLASVCALPDSLRCVPPLVSQCTLYQLEPVGKECDLTPLSWKPRATQVLREMASSTTKVRMKVFERDNMGVLYIDLYTEGLSVCQRLVNVGLGRIRKSEVLSIPPPLCLPLGQPVAALVIAAQTPQDFYVHQAYYVEELKALEGKVKEMFSGGKMPLLGAPIVGMWACAVFKDDGQYYRVKITSVSANGVGVLYIDYGNTDLVSFSDLYQLPVELMETRRQAIHCKLHSVGPPGDEGVWPESSSNYFYKLVNMATPVLLTCVREVGVAQPEGGVAQPHPVAVSFEDTKENVAQLMVDAGKARWLPSAEKAMPTRGGGTRSAAASLSQELISPLSTPTPPPARDWTHTPTPPPARVVTHTPTPPPARVVTHTPTPPPARVVTHTPTPPPARVVTHTPTPPPARVVTHTPTPPPARVVTHTPTPPPARVVTHTPTPPPARVVTHTPTPPPARVVTHTPTPPPARVVTHTPTPPPARVVTHTPTPPPAEVTPPPLAGVTVIPHLGVTNISTPPPPGFKSLSSSPAKSLTLLPTPPPSTALIANNSDKTGTPVRKASSDKTQFTTPLSTTLPLYQSPTLALPVTTPPILSAVTPVLPVTTPPILSAVTPALPVTTPPAVAMPTVSIPPAVLPAIEELFTCRIVHVESSSTFYIVRETDFKHLLSALSNFSPDEEVGVANTWEVGQAALGLYGEQWCRIIYQGLDDTGTYHQALFVDYGNHGVVSTVTGVPAGLCVSPALALRCTTTLSETEFLSFIDRVFNKTWLVRIKGRADENTLVVALEEPEDESPVPSRGEVAESPVPSQDEEPLLSQEEGGVGYEEIDDTPRAADVVKKDTLQDLTSEEETAADVPVETDTPQELLEGVQDKAADDVSVATNTPQDLTSEDIPVVQEQAPGSECSSSDVDTSGATLPLTEGMASPGATVPCNGAISVPESDVLTTVSADMPSCVQAVDTLASLSEGKDLPATSVQSLLPGHFLIPTQ